MNHNISGTKDIIKGLRADLNRRIARGEIYRSLLFVTICAAIGMAAHSSWLPYQVGRVTGFDHYSGYLLALPVLLLVLTVWHVRRRRKRRAHRSYKMLQGKFWDKGEAYIGRPPHWIRAMSAAILFFVAGYFGGGQVVPVFEAWDEREPQMATSFERYFTDRYGGPVHPDTCEIRPTLKAFCKEDLLLRPWYQVRRFLETGRDEGLGVPPL